MINLQYYTGNAQYSDGSIEIEMRKMIEDGLDIEDVLTKDNRWPLLYHFSPMRRNLLEWYPFSSEECLLEIGAGCGALTGFFCEKLHKVVAVELSKLRSEIIDLRFKNHNNLEIIAGNFMDMAFGDKFDYITLIGVLEYTKNFIAGDNPYRDFLSKIYENLKEDGKLFIAIENKFALKYFAGAREDHSGIYFDSIEDYYSGSNCETFSKQELMDMLNSIGFYQNKFYYPYPDYKLPGVIYSDDYLPKINDALIDSINYDNDKIKLFSEQIAFKNIIKNKLFDVFSNSFLIISKKGA